MADSGNNSSLSEQEIREVVRDELRNSRGGATSRRRLLGALGVLGAAGLAGSGVEQRSPTDEPSTATSGAGSDQHPLSLTDLLTDGEPIPEPIRTLNFRRNMRTEVDGGRVSIDAVRGLDVVGSGVDETGIESIEVGWGLEAAIEDGTLTIARPEFESLPDDDLEGQIEALSEQIQSRGFLARRGDLQSTLDDALEDGVGHVHLESGATYQIDTPIEVPPGVTLNCTGAHIELRADVNAFELHTQSQVVNPQVRTTEVDGYSSTVFHIYPKQFGDGFGTDRPVPVWTVSGGWSEMTPGEGTCIELHGTRANPQREYDVARDNRNVYFCFVSHNCIGGRRFAYLHREGGDTTRGGHVNGNIIKGYADNATVFVETDDSASGKNMVNGNKFYLVTQPYDESEWLWYANKGSRNELYEWGKNWDYARYSDSDGDGYAENWYIGPNAGKNFVWRKLGSASGGLGSTVVDDSDGASGSRYLVLEEMGIPVGDLDVWRNAT